MGRDSVYLGEGHRDASIQLNVICQLSELVLLLLKCLQQTVDLLLRQHNSAVVLQKRKDKIRQNPVLYAQYFRKHCLTFVQYSEQSWLKLGFIAIICRKCCNF